MRRQRFRTILADPPWPETGGGKIRRGADRHYKLMTVQQIKALPVQDLAADNAHLYLWVTNNFLEDGLAVMNAWGFRYVTTITWLKLGKVGLGQYFRGKTEHCLFGVRGKLPYKVRGGKRQQGVTSIVAVRGEHSAKPEVMREMITRVSYGPRLELFARKRVPGGRWKVWGNQVKSDVVLKVGRSIRYPLPEVKAWLDEVGPTLPGQAQESHGAPKSPKSTQMSMFGTEDELLPSNWSAAVALDPKHRPQVPDAPSSTARKDWRKYPQEAHLLDVAGHRYRRLTEDEIAVIQGFPPDWGKDLGLTHRERIAGLGNAVPPPVGEVLYRALQAVLPEPPRTAVEICAGFGGLAIGAHRAGNIEILALVEFWEAAVRVLRAAGHWDPSRVHLGDVKAFDWARFADKVDVLSGGPPCQPWSVAGLSRGAEDERDLLGEMPGLVQVLRPRAFLFENVPGLLTPTHRGYLEELVVKLRGQGAYGVAVGTIQAADYGVPQTRKRVIIAGIRGATDGAAHDYFDRLYELRTHANPAGAIPRGRRAWVTVGAALPQWPRVGGWRRWLGDPKRARRAAPGTRY